MAGGYITDASPAIIHQDNVIPPRMAIDVVERIQRKLVVEQARTWLGTPYQSNQGCKGVGVDCAWILLRVYTECCLIEAFQPPPYKGALARMREGELFYRNMIERFAVEVQRPAEPGDIVLFRIPLFARRDGHLMTRATHGAIVTEWPRVVHAYQPACRVVESDLATDKALGDHVEAVFSLRRWEDRRGR